MANYSTLSILIHEAKKGVPQAQSKLIDFFWFDVKGYILSKVNEEVAAEELTVETFTKAITKLHLYNEDFDFKTWLISIAHNTSLDYFRKQKVKNELFVALEKIKLESLAEPEENSFIISHIQKVESLISTLDEKYRSVMELKYFEEKSVKEIAEILHLSETNVKVRLMRGRKLLDEKMK